MSDEPRPYRPARRSGPPAWFWLLLVLGTAAGGIGLAVAVSKDTRKAMAVPDALSLDSVPDQIRSLEDLSLSLTTQQMVEKVNRSWSYQQGGKACEKYGGDVAAKLEKETLQKEADHIKRFGAKYDRLKALDPDRSVAVATFQTAATRKTAAVIDTNLDRMKADLAALRKRIVDEDNFQLTQPAGHDRSTVRGQQLYDEEARLLPAIHAKETAEFRARVDRLYAERAPAIVCKWHKTTVDEVIREAAALAKAAGIGAK